MHLQAENIAELLMGAAIFLNQMREQFNRKKVAQRAEERANEIKVAIEISVLGLKEWVKEHFVSKPDGSSHT